MLRLLLFEDPEFLGNQRKLAFFPGPHDHAVKFLHIQLKFLIFLFVNSEPMCV